LEKLLLKLQDLNHAREIYTHTHTHTHTLLKYAFQHFRSSEYMAI